MVCVSKQKSNIQRLAVFSHRPPLSADDAERSSLDVEGALFPLNDDSKTEDQKTVNLPFPVNSIALNYNDLHGWVGAISGNQLDALLTQCWLHWKDGAESQLKNEHNRGFRVNVLCKPGEKASHGRIYFRM